LLFSSRSKSFPWRALVGAARERCFIPQTSSVFFARKFFCALFFVLRHRLRLATKNSEIQLFDVQAQRGGDLAAPASPYCCAHFFIASRDRR
jgi:hypothetical protein